MKWIQGLILILMFPLMALAKGATVSSRETVESEPILTHTENSKSEFGIEKVNFEKSSSQETATPLLNGKVTEDQIPLHLDKKDNKTAEVSPWARMILGFFVILAMAGGLWLYLRRTRKLGQNVKAQQIKIIAQHWLGPKKSLAIIRIAGESILIGVTEQNINLIKPLSLLDDEIPEEAPAPFKQTLKKQNQKSDVLQDEEEDFQLSGLGQIKDVVSDRLKQMRTLSR